LSESPRPDGPPAPTAQLDGFAAVCAHQAGEAVALLSGALSLLRNGGESDPALGALEAAQRRLRNMTEDFLDLGLGASEREVADSVDATEALRAAWRSLSRDPAAEGSRLQAAPLPDVRVDRRRLERIFVHLLRSAVAAAERGTARIEVAGRPDGDSVRIEVADEGPVGADVDALAGGRLARPGHGSLMGAGVGLVVAHRMVADEGGRMEITARPEGGLIVALTLPAGARR
jgi:C4-dicarboxylate-specific signal transduction histidine kinase